MNNIKKRLMALALVTLSVASISSPVFAKASIGSVEMYKTDNVTSDGLGDYLLEIKLKEGWKPYQPVQVGLVDGVLCMAYDKGYKMGDHTNQYILEGVSGAILEDEGNNGYIWRGKVTNPTNSTITVPLKLCEGHGREPVYTNGSIEVVVGDIPSGGYMAKGYADFKTAKPISDRDNSQQPTTPDKTYKEDVSFTINKSSYTLTTKTGEKITKQMSKGDEPFMSNGRTMLPVRYAGEALNAQIEWNPAKREVIVKKGSTTVRLPLNSQYALYSDGSKVDMGAKTIQKNGRTFVPVGALGSIINATFTWDEQTETVTFDSSNIE